MPTFPRASAVREGSSSPARTGGGLQRSPNGSEPAPKRIRDPERLPQHTQAERYRGCAVKYLYKAITQADSTSIRHASRYLHIHDAPTPTRARSAHSSAHTSEAFPSTSKRGTGGSTSRRTRASSGRAPRAPPRTPRRTRRPGPTGASPDRALQHSRRGVSAARLQWRVNGLPRT